MNIRLDKVERDCPANTNARKKYDRTVVGRHLIFDFNIFIDGEHRAIWLRQAYASRGENYQLRDADHRMIRQDGTDRYTGRNSGRPVHAPNQRMLEEITLNVLDLIPTLEQMAELRAEERRLKDEREADEAERRRISRIESLGPRLLDAIKPLMDAAALASEIRRNGSDVPATVWATLDFAVTAARDAINATEKIDEPAITT